MRVIHFFYVFLSDISEIRPKTKKKLLQINHLEDIGPGDEDFVKPLKITSQELHEDDIIFDQMRNISNQPPLRHHSGHFRHKMAEVWDPYPSYELVAFGRKYTLELGHNRKFIAPDLQVKCFFFLLKFHVDAVCLELTRKERIDRQMFF